MLVVQIGKCEIESPHSHMGWGDTACHIDHTWRFINLYLRSPSCGAKGCGLRFATPPLAFSVGSAEPALRRSSGRAQVGGAMAAPTSPDWGGGQGERGGEGEAHGGEHRRASESATSGGSVEDFVRLDSRGAEARGRGQDGAPVPEGPQGEDPWSRADPWSQRQGEYDQHQWGNWQWSWGWQQDWWSRDARGKDYADPPAWPGWGANYRLWKRAVQRWNTTTDVALDRRAERVFKTMD